MKSINGKPLLALSLLIALSLSQMPASWAVPVPAGPVQTQAQPQRPVQPLTQPTTQPQRPAVQEEEDDDDAPDAHAYLPIHGSFRQLTGRTQHVVRVDLEPELQATVEKTDTPDPLVQRTYKLMETALSNDPNLKKADAAATKYAKGSQKALATAKDALNILTYYRGFGPSSEAGDVLLDEKVKLKSLPAAEYAKQRCMDDAHLEVMQSVMQIATGAGVADPKVRDEIIKTGTEELAKRVGEDEAQRTVEVTMNWLKKVKVTDDLYKQRSWDPHQQKVKLKIVEDAAQKHDQVLKKVRDRIHKYNHKSKAMMAASHVIEGTLGLVSLAPNFAGPAAVAALTAFEISTGGAEQDKMIKEIYLFKRIQSRSTVINKKAEMALHNYQLGMAAHNPAQVAFAEAIVEEMSGSDVVQQVFGKSVLPD